MATIINKLFGKKKNTVAEPLEPHETRYLFDFTEMPSVSAYGAPLVFVEGEEDHESFYSSSFTKFSDIFPLSSLVNLKTYSVREGQIAVFTFPDPVASPEVKYGICVFAYEGREKPDGYESYELLPYYILTKIVGVWVIGEVKPYPKKPNNYFTTYYEQVDSPDLLQFVDWVMKRENLTPIEYKDKYPDLVEKHLRSKNK